MEMTKNDAIKLLNSFATEEKNSHFIKHSICVGNTAEVIAKALNLDSDFAATLGYLHDIGKGVGGHEGHDLNGYEFVKNLDYDEKYANICLTHSYLNNDVFCTAGGIPEDLPQRTKFIKNHEYSIYEKIINLCDLMCTDRVLTVDKRLIDIILRRGAYENTQYHVTETYKLKKFFDDMLGYNLYDLFPEIKNNL